jgi:hypothetical protein
VSLPTRYAGWMARDVIMGPGIPMAALTTLAALLVSKLQASGPTGSADQAACLFVLDWTGVALALMATAGVVSADFAIGHQRTLFAKPVSPPLYYLQRWLLGGIAVLLGAVVVGLTIAVRFDIPLVGAGFVARVALLYLVVGGLVFLFSVFTRRDWLLAVVLIAWQGAIAMAHAMGLARGPVGAVLDLVLPPMQLVRLADPLPAGADLVHVVVYGIAVLCGALGALRWRPLARGARE